jgi:nitrilase
MTTPTTLKVAVAQSHTQATLSSTLALLRTQTTHAASQGTSIILFPEAFLGGYPRSCNFGAAIGSRTTEGREQFLQYYKSSVDLGDTPEGAGDAWLEQKLPVNKVSGVRGDGTREILEDIARSTGVFIVTGCVERAGGSLYCTALFVDPKEGIIGKRRKVQPTGSERLVWAQGQPSSLKAIPTTIKGVRVVMGCAICWENYMPLLRYSLYAQGVNLWLAPTADPRATWEPLMRTVAFEGRCWVLSGNQCIKNKNLPEWITGKKHEGTNGVMQVNGTMSPPPSTSATAQLQNQQAARGRRRSMTTRTLENHEIAWPEPEPGPNSPNTITTPAPSKVTPSLPENVIADDPSAEQFASRGGSLIASPTGTTVAGPLWDNDDGIIYADIDFDECARGKLDFDASGHYGRLDAFKLTVEGLDLSPPP